MSSLVRVWTDVGARKPVALLAKIIEKDGVILTIRYLSESGVDHIWRYETDMYEIDDDSVAEYLKTDSETDLGFVQHEDGFIKVETDEDYVPSEDGESDFDEEEESDAESEESNVGEE
jgi:hypothetical protein